MVVDDCVCVCVCVLSYSIFFHDLETKKKLVVSHYKHKFLRKSDCRKSQMVVNDYVYACVCVCGGGGVWVLKTEI
ncbi:hypothetical protein HanXRQr2_Chr08g0331391 [Helianthus annuus]|uniref:Uncharacterized protein n=1 Tax=Helianthus annuus TaxID=4232 RepID=A0A9K3IDT6_HELAN|nr:hypothetical protein HanXRQr2_Chr08g0331391 [Helianthus annuus]KAJ0901015.1 hypothetical protein HanPSC8_Chr08g0320401 [Helianthus annuus]